MKTITIILAIIIIVFSGCTSESNNQVICSEAHYKYGQEALEIADKYLNYEISSTETFDLIDNLYSSEDELPETESGDQTHITNLAIEADVLSLHSRMLSLSLGYSNYEEIKNATENLRNDIDKIDSYVIIK